ncbi:MAG: pyridoxamine 5'-phosphate oxidase family protein [Alphaproteobacteria bacterium]|nr:pyridoxamine 5'-phosphate oxidase family protein [Alphaproteobacteria bacterium]
MSGGVPPRPLTRPRACWRAYADFRGNRQYLSAGNLSRTGRVSLILMDYPNRRRLKSWGRAGIVDASDNQDLIEDLHRVIARRLPAYREQAARRTRQSRTRSRLK